MEWLSYLSGATPEMRSDAYAVALPPDSRYVTDGRRLYRVVEGLEGSTNRDRATLEDCYTLELHVFTADSLWRMGLRRVRTEADAAVPA